MAGFEIDCNDGKGEPSACHHTAEFYSVVKDEHNRSAKIYRENCHNKKYAPSCFNLAKLLLSGKGVPQDDDAAMNHFDKRDPPKALSLLSKACEFNHAQSCFNMAVLYRKGDEGVPADPAKFEVYKEKTESLASQLGGLKGIKKA